MPRLCTIALNLANRSFRKQQPVIGEIADYTKAIDMIPPNVRPYYSIYYADRGDQYAKKGDWQKAADDYAEAIRLSKERGDNPRHFEEKYKQLDEKRKAPDKW